MTNIEVLIDCYFDNLFVEMERGSLLSRHKRRELVKYFTAIIKNCAQAEDLEQEDVCERIVMAALRYHNTTVSENGSVCLLGKFHNVLYIAAKLCYDWDLKKNGIVSRLLDDIYYCEKTFERILIGAMFGTSVTHFLSGWKSDFKDRDESIKALIYFMDHANAARLEYHCESSTVKRRFVDVPMESYGQAFPVRVAIQLGAPDILLLLLRYGAVVNPDDLTPSSVEVLLGKLCLYKAESSPPNTAYPPDLVDCLKLLLRAIPGACFNTPTHTGEQCEVFTFPACEQYPNFIDQDLVPPDRSGQSAPELKHLCRCRIRDVLSENWALPHGIRELEIPTSLQDYLDLLKD